MNFNKLNCFLRFIPLIQKSTLLRSCSGHGLDSPNNYIYDKAAIITGGAAGIGQECALELLRHGIRGIVIADLLEDERGLDYLKKEYSCCNVVYKHCDITNKDQLEELFDIAKDYFNGCDILLNCAGILNDANWEREIVTNVIGNVRATYRGIERMGTHSDFGACGGVIVNVSSIFGMQYLPGSPVYVGTSHFLQGFSRSIGDPYHFNRTGVRVLTLCPGVTDTDMIRNADKFADKKFYKGMGRILTKALRSLPKQGTETVAKNFIEMLNEAKTGTIWVSEDYEYYEIKIPSRTAIRVG